MLSGCEGAEPPAHLSDDARDWWEAVTGTFELEPHHVRLLQAACESWDAAQRAREAVAEHGVLVEGRYGQLVANPAASIEKENRLAFARLVGQLDLDAERAPAPAGWNGAA
jgi:P27 family predicted phage terminase small subunit